MAVDGEPATWVTILPHLLTIWLAEGLYRRTVWRCRCSAGRCAEVPEGLELPGGAWTRCPYGVLRDPHFQALLILHECATIAAPAGWPEAYPAWLSWGMVQLQRWLDAERQKQRGAR